MTRTAAMIGGGVIGGGWAARFALMGWNVRVFDPGPDAARNLDAVLANARRSLPGLSDVALPPEGQVTLHPSVAEAVRDATWVQESVPERLDIKHAVFAEIAASAPADAIVGSSTSGFTPTQLQRGGALAERIVVAHPFNPVYLLPLVELVGSAATPPGVIARAREILTGLGMAPLHLRREIDAHVADRLLEAVWREALWLVRDGIATTAEIDDAIRMGFGLRWAQMGLFETYRIAGGEAGMRHFLYQFGPCLSWPWSRLTDVPDLTPELIETIAAQSDAQSGGHSIRDLEQIRDANLVAILRALKAQNRGAGAVLRDHDMALRGRHPAADHALGGPMITLERCVPLDWTDYNGHMNEARYLHAFGDATDRFMEIVGCDAEYIRSGGSFFTAETHIRHIDEVHAGHTIRVETLLLKGEGSKMHLFHRMYAGERLLATGEHFLLHVSLATRRPSPPSEAIAARLGRIAAVHADLPRPDGIGRAVGRK